MNAKELCKRVRELCEPFVEELGVTLWDVEFEKEGGQYMLTVTIDRDGHTDIDDCEKLSRSIDPLLDAKEFASLPPYTLCVSSAGIARRLKRPEHFAAFLGSEVEVRFYRPIAGSKMAVGVLRDYDEGRVTLEQDGTVTVFEPKDIAAVHLWPEI
ncbi:MAG: ribosome maturation factor RimP [Clostridiales bacterium]|nr:ribosome maturation factor RimP [Clostridiales bacterium]